ncbi:MAG TPA: hypothetical protein VGO73_10110 [Pyrinomonadaceae bacterium]|jgi:hypothetical protein|nr:hypothetical protein [Pyrinomonadaceae bacterium]
MMFSFSGTLVPVFSRPFHGLGFSIDGYPSTRSGWAIFTRPLRGLGLMFRSAERKPKDTLSVKLVETHHDLIGVVGKSLGNSAYGECGSVGEWQRD